MRDFRAKVGRWEGGLIALDKLPSHTHLTPVWHLLGGAPVSHPILGQHHFSFLSLLGTWGLHAALLPEQEGAGMQ